MGGMPVCWAVLSAAASLGSVLVARAGVDAAASAPVSDARPGRP